MDSQDFLIVVMPPATRDESDVMLQRAIDWIASCAIPERVFDAAQLHAWALRSGYEKKDNTELIDLLRQADGVLPHPSKLTRAINDAVMIRLHA